MENIKWFINQGVAVFALCALLYIEFKRAGCLSKLPKIIENLVERVRALEEIIKKNDKK